MLEKTILSLRLWRAAACTDLGGPVTEIKGETAEGRGYLQTILELEEPRECSLSCLSSKRHSVFFWGQLSHVSDLAIQGQTRTTRHFGPDKPLQSCYLNSAHLHWGVGLVLIFLQSGK